MAARFQAGPCISASTSLRTHDGAAAHEGFVVVLDAVAVIKIVEHDAEGFLDRTELGVAEPVDLLEPRAVAEVKTRYRVHAVSGRWPSRQEVGGAYAPPTA
jgi:hypothetical protein